MGVWGEGICPSSWSLVYIVCNYSILALASSPHLSLLVASVASERGHLGLCIGISMAYITILSSATHPWA